MENRALLAFALSMAVFFLYMQFVAPKPQPRPAPRGAPGAVTAPTAAPAPATAATQLRAAPPLPPVTAASPVEASVVLSNALVSATFSTTRALEGWVLHDYRAEPTKHSKPVDLADVGLDESSLRLSFLPDAPAPGFALQASGATSVTFVSTGAGPLAESRTWRLREGYVAELEWTAINRGKTALVLRPTVQLAEGLDYEKMSRYDMHSPIVAHDTKIERPGKKDVAKSPVFTEVHWAGFDNKYFLKAVLPPAGMREVGADVAELGKNGDVTQVGVRVGFAQQLVQPGQAYTTTLRFYYGPKVASMLAGPGVGLESSIDYGFFSFLAKPLLALMKLFHKWVLNYGVAIILVTILIKLLFYPLTRKSFTAMRDMQRVQPKLDDIKKKYAKDKERLNREMMELYRTEGINPLGGCLPMILQIPVFFALYQVLLNSIELRHAPFMLWVNDLSAPEHLFTLHLLGYDLPFRLLPLVMGVTMVLQQKLTPSTMDKAQQQVMMIMPVMFTFLFWGFPAGLVLYWLVNNVISIGQQWWITRGAKAAA